MGKLRTPAGRRFNSQRAFVYFSDASCQVQPQTQSPRTGPSHELVEHPGKEVAGYAGSLVLHCNNRIAGFRPALPLNLDLNSDSPSLGRMFHCIGYKVFYCLPEFCGLTSATASSGASSAIGTLLDCNIVIVSRTSTTRSTGSGESVKSPCSISPDVQ